MPNEYAYSYSQLKKGIGIGASFSHNRSYITPKAIQEATFSGCHSAHAAMALGVASERRIARIAIRLATVSGLWRQLCKTDAELQELNMRRSGSLSHGATTERLEQQQVRLMDCLLDEVDDEIADTHGKAFGVFCILLAALRPRQALADG